MAKMDPEELARKLGSGLLSFPVTHFTQDFAFDEAPYREHIEWLLKYSPAGLFAAGGTGEFFSLTMPEFGNVVSAAAQQTNGRVPVVAGCGYGTAIAIQFAKTAEASGADGILLLPPYLVNSEPAGLMAHVEAVCASTALGVIFYNRDNAILNESAMERLCDRCSNLVGFKDGYGDIELMTRIYARLGDRLTYIGGLPSRVRAGVLRRSAQARSRRSFQAASGVCVAIHRDPQSQKGLCCLDCEGRNAGDWPTGGSCADAAHGSGSKRNECAEPTDRWAVLSTLPWPPRSRRMFAT
jgi:hypothetical protein